MLLWNELTDLDERKRAIAIIGQLDGEPKSLAKTIKSSELCKQDGINTLIGFLDKSFALSNEDRVDADLMDLLDWTITGITFTTKASRNYRITARSRSSLHRGFNRRTRRLQRYQENLHP